MSCVTSFCHACDAAGTLTFVRTVCEDRVLSVIYGFRGRAHRLHVAEHFIVHGTNDGDEDIGEQGEADDSCRDPKCGAEVKSLAEHISRSHFVAVPVAIKGGDDDEEGVKRCAVARSLVAESHVKTCVAIQCMRPAG